jgi:hypothetical protein
VATVRRWPSTSALSAAEAVRQAELEAQCTGQTTLRSDAVERSAAGRASGVCMEQLGSSRYTAARPLPEQAAERVSASAVSSWSGSSGSGTSGT